jgi:hypothetical protein
MTGRSPLRTAASLFKSDALEIVRDPALAVVAAMAIAPIAVFHQYADPIDAFFVRVAALSGFTGLASGFVVCLPGLLIGWICAMRFLDDRDCNLEPALMATPPGLVGVALPRMAAAALLAAALCAMTARVLDASAAASAVIGACGALQAIVVAALLPVLAKNKVEGLAYSKFLSPLALFALIALLADTLRLAAVPMATFHMGELMTHGADPVRAATALAVNLVWAAAAVAGFRRRTMRISP